MAEWKEYNGSDDQITEMENHQHGFACRFKHGDNGDTRYDVGIQRYTKNILLSELSHYLLCEPHPLREMIKQQADTGQEVWVRRPAHRFDWDRVLGNVMVDYIKTEQTTKPDWNIPNAEYSLTPFKDN